MHDGSGEKEEEELSLEKKRKMSGLKVRMERPHRTPTKLEVPGESVSRRHVCGPLMLFLSSQELWEEWSRS